MSAKKKNPLKDLNAFLTHQEEASKIAIPKKVKDHEEFMVQKPSQVTAVNRPEKVKIAEEATPLSVINMMKQLMEENPDSSRKILGDIILQTIERMPDSQPADKMLINTVLYLNNQKDWKSALESYWDSRS